MMEKVGRSLWRRERNPLTNSIRIKHGLHTQRDIQEEEQIPFYLPDLEPTPYLNYPPDKYTPQQ